MNQNDNFTQNQQKNVYPKEYQEPSKTADAYTFDYNKIYNVAPEPIPIENNPANQMDNILTSDDSFNQANNVSLSSTNNDANTSFESLQMAAPPSFEEPQEEEKEEVVMPVIPDVKKEDLVSIDIVEPSALPVGNAVRDSMYLDTPLTREPNSNSQQESTSPLTAAEEMNPFGFNTRPSVPRNESGPRIRQVPNQGNVQSQWQAPNNLRPSTNSSAPSSELSSDPMAIFGVKSGLRPTAGEALSEQPQNGVRQAPMPNNGIGVCPNCGFTVKPGQPLCVVCGYRFK